MRFGAVVICGGKSTRMGQPKLSLPFGNELMLQRVCRIVGQVVSPIVVVAANGQEVPPLPADIRVVRDEYDDQGPLAGLATGLKHLQEDCDAAFVTACDAPLLKAEFIQRLIDQLDDFDAVVPFDGEFVHVLTAVYRTRLEQPARDLLAANQRRLLKLVQDHRSRSVSVEELRDVDPELDSLRNTNSPEDFAEALRRGIGQ